MWTFTSGLRCVSVMNATSISFSSRKSFSLIVLLLIEQAFQLTRPILAAIFNNEHAKSDDLVETGFATAQPSGELRKDRHQLLRSVERSRFFRCGTFIFRLSTESGRRERGPFAGGWSRWCWSLNRRSCRCQSLLWL